MTPLQTLALKYTDSVLVYPFILGLSAFDALAIVLPSETLVAALASTAMTLGSPNVVLLALAAAVGAHVGDVALFGVGRLARSRVSVLKSLRVEPVLEWTRQRLERQGPIVIVSARYIPYGRIVVNVTAGSSGYSFRRFVALSALGCLVWAFAYAAIGAGIGVWLGDRWWLAIVAAVVVAVSLAVIVDRLMRRAAA